MASGLCDTHFADTLPGLASNAIATPPHPSKRGPGNHLKPDQAEYLRNVYRTNQKPSKEERESMAVDIGVEAKTIAVSGSFNY